jgi:hypothetical protein
MKATVILIAVLLALAAMLLVPHSGGVKAFEPASMMVSGALLIALGSAVRRHHHRP